MIINVHKQKIKAKIADYHWYSYFFEGKKDTSYKTRTRVVISILWIPIFWYIKDY